MTEREIQAAKLDTSRDLAADLAEIDKHEPVWRISLLWEGRTEYAWKEYEAWRNRLPLVAASAIRRAAAAESVRAYVLHDGGGLYLSFGKDAVEAARALLVALGEPDADTERFSVSASWDLVPQDLGRLWPHFTANPPERVQGRRLLREEDR